MATTTTTLLPLQSRTNFSLQPSPSIALGATVTQVQLTCHVQGFTSPATSMHFSIERSADSGTSWQTIYDSGVQAGGQTGEKSGILGDVLMGMVQAVRPQDVGPTVQWRGRVAQVGTYSFDMVALVTTTP